jgi:universal stress protein A
MGYRHLIAAVSLDDDGLTVLKRAQALARQEQAALTVLHVVEYIPLESGEALMAMPTDLSQQLVQQAREQLTQRCESLGIPASALQIANGNAAREIKRVAGEQGADLIVIGHHPRHGWASLFSHTEENLVTRADCDVLVVALSSAG